ncbi:helix-turn-helix transcriptional regulator [Rathayibacter tanaceti]|uniref:Helix-turn-helix domain-containing protein n=2 Tax=Rathayibacter tanaceti TaxID=1671680 RepID=A0A166IL23_9MICO|nr:helix-turn-helix transcriptional regulator [Rathayibacter tanaceti]KZX22553.1 helix-turn-helix protein [Rathayibacter tanaceti]QHC54770.1 helix-turn-helix domain-containing protein [Rathayibacter tanaceti]TCO37410.1 helix-turn-helix protein [Rathayibacter tanaceti]
MDNSNEVREFLTSRRARLRPEDVGLRDFGGRRRVQGLRREEVAMLAGVSTEYYSRLERGQISGVSEQVLDALSNVLKLDDAEREYLGNLARGAQITARSRTRRPSSPGVRSGIRAALAAITGAPAFVRNGAMDILAANDLGRAFYSPIYAKRPSRPNLASFTVFDPAAQTFYPDWIAAVDATVAVLRQEAGRDPFNKRITEVIGELSTRSEPFRDRWANANVRRHDAVAKIAKHPVVGSITLELVGTELLADPGLSLMIYAATPGTPAEDQLRLLGAWAATNLQDVAGAPRADA